MFRFLIAGGASMLAVGCFGGGTEDDAPLAPEICDNEKDDNGNGLIDCDDTQFCGGPVNCPGGIADSFDTGDDGPPLLEINFNDDPDCANVFGKQDCRNKDLCNLRVVNRSGIDADLSASCDNPNPEPKSSAPVLFRVLNTSGNSISSFEVGRGSAVIVNIVNDSCEFPESWNTDCRAVLEFDDESTTFEWSIDSVFSANKKP